MTLKITCMTTSAPTQPELLHALKEAVQAGMPQAIADLSALVRIPSVSWAAFDADKVKESAQAVADLVRGLGVFETVKISQAPTAAGYALGMPAVLATRKARAGRP